jgi:hypothetical protein
MCSKSKPLNLLIPTIVKPCSSTQNDTPSLRHDMHIIKLSSKAIKPKNGTMVFPKTKDNLVKIQDEILSKEKTQISSSTHDDLNFITFHVFGHYLHVYLRAYLYYKIPKGRSRGYTKPI